MKAVILCGGKGTRIRDVSEILPKPMVPIGGKPILWHIMKIYSHYGINDFILCLGYRGWMIKEYFLNFKAINNDFTIEVGKPNELHFHDAVEESSWKVTLADTGDESMTGARLWKIRKYLEGEKRFCLTYGDGLAGINVKALLDFHDQSGKLGLITGVRPAGRFGELNTDGITITHFNEKPQISEGWVNGGFMVLNNDKVWDYLWPDDKLVFEKEPLPAMVKDRQLGMFKHEGFWMGMDTLREYTILNELWDGGKAPWKIW